MFAFAPKPKESEAQNKAKAPNQKRSETAPRLNTRYVGPVVSPGARVAAIRQSILQRKAAISEPGDIYEREADEVADTVMRMAEPAPLGAAPMAIQRKCAACEEEDKKTIQREFAPSANHDVALDAGTALRATERGGAPLPQAARDFFEARFGQDFSRVRVQVDDAAARAVQARAYTVGQNIVFGRGQYAPGTTEGRRLLAHELTHVVQQSGGSTGATTAPGARAVQRAPSGVLQRKENLGETRLRQVLNGLQGHAAAAVLEIKGFTSDPLNTVATDADLATAVEGAYAKLQAVLKKTGFKTMPAGTMRLLATSALDAAALAKVQAIANDRHWTVVVYRAASATSIVEEMTVTPKAALAGALAFPPGAPFKLKLPDIGAKPVPVTPQLTLTLPDMGAKPVPVTPQLTLTLPEIGPKPVVAPPQITLDTLISHDYSAVKNDPQYIDNFTNDPNTAWLPNDRVLVFEYPNGSMLKIALKDLLAALQMKTELIQQPSEEALRKKYHIPPDLELPESSSSTPFITVGGLTPPVVSFQRDLDSGVIYPAGSTISPVHLPRIRQVVAQIESVRANEELMQRALIPILERIVAMEWSAPRGLGPLLVRFGRRVRALGGGAKAAIPIPKGPAWPALEEWGPPIPHEELPPPRAGGAKALPAAPVATPKVVPAKQAVGEQPRGNLNAENAGKAPPNPAKADPAKSGQAADVEAARAARQAQSYAERFENLRKSGKVTDTGGQLDTIRAGCERDDPGATGNLEALERYVFEEGKSVEALKEVENQKVEVDRGGQKISKPQKNPDFRVNSEAREVKSRDDGFGNTEDCETYVNKEIRAANTQMKRAGTGPDGQPTRGVLEIQFRNNAAKQVGTPEFLQAILARTARVFRIDQMRSLVRIDFFKNGNLIARFVRNMDGTIKQTVP